MVMVSAIALMADVSVGRQCQLLIQHEGEHISRRERVRLALPSVAPPTTAQHRALVSLGHDEQTTANERDSHHSCRQGRRAHAVKLSGVTRCHDDQVVLNVMLRCVLTVLSLCCDLYNLSSPKEGSDLSYNKMKPNLAI